MNWVGGARSRVKSHGDRRLQKEFFERKKMDLMSEKAQRQKSYHSSKSRKKHISQDLVALHTVSNASMKGNSPRATNIQHIDLDRRRGGWSVGRLDTRLPGSLGSHPPRIPDTVNLPYSPDLFPSKLQLNESVTPRSSKGWCASRDGDLSGPGSSPFLRRDGVAGSSTNEKLEHSYIEVDMSESTRNTPQHRRNEKEKFQMQEPSRAPHFLFKYNNSHSIASPLKADCIETNPSHSIPKGYKAPELTPRIQQTETEIHSPLGLREPHPSHVRSVRDQFIPLTKQSKLLRSSDEEKQATSYSQSQRATYWRDNLILYEDCQNSQNHGIGKRKLSSSQVSTTEQNVVGDPDPQSCMTNLWARNSLTRSLSPVTDCTRPILYIDKHPTKRPKDMPVVEDIEMREEANAKSQKMRIYQLCHRDRDLTSVNDRVFVDDNFHSIMQSSQMERHSPQPESIKSSPLVGFKSKAKHLWMSEDFQPSPLSSALSTSGGTPSACLSNFPTPFRKPKSSKWDTFLEYTERSNSPPFSRVSDPQTPSLNVWKTQTDVEKSASCFSDSTHVDRKFSSLFGKERWSYSDSETNSKCSGKLANDIKTKQSITSFGPRMPLLKTYSETRLFQSQRTGDEEDILMSRTRPGNRTHDWRGDSLSQSNIMPFKSKDSADEEQTMGTTKNIGLTTTMSNMLRHPPPEAFSATQWPQRENQAEEVLQELEQLEALSEDARTGSNSRGEGTVHSNSPGRLHNLQEVRTVHRYSHLALSQIRSEVAGTMIKRHPSPTNNAHRAHVKLMQSRCEPELNRHYYNDTNEKQETILEPGANLVESQGSPNIESDYEENVPDVVEALVQAVVGKCSPTTDQLAVSDSSKTLQEPSVSGDQEIDKQTAKDVLLHELDVELVDSDHDSNYKDKHTQDIVSLHAYVQTDMTLLHVDIPVNWVPTVVIPHQSVEDRAVQWESPSSSQKSTTTSEQGMECSSLSSYQKHSATSAQIPSEQCLTTSPSSQQHLNSASQQSQTKQALPSPKHIMTPKETFSSQSASSLQRGHIITPPPPSSSQDSSEE